MLPAKLTTGRVFVIQGKYKWAGSVVVNAFGSDTIDGGNVNTCVLHVATINISVGGTMTFVSDSVSNLLAY